MAYYVFESLSGIHATWHMLGDSMKEVTHRLMEQVEDLVRGFTYTQEEKAAIMEEEQTMKLGLAIGVALALIGMAFMAPVAPFITLASEVAVFELALTVMGSISNAYIAAQAIVGAVVTGGR